jgi:hypothetical protein
MKARTQPPYLARETYRRRRLIDAARLLPIFGMFLILLPVLWPPIGPDIPATAREAVYLFVIWFGLVVGAALLARRLTTIMRADKRGH